eukprot:CFRG6724T1
MCLAVSVVILKPVQRPVQNSTGNSTCNYEVLLINRGKEPTKDEWSFPGGSLESGGTVIQGALRELEEETGLQLPFVEPFHAFDAIIPNKPFPL